MSLRNQPYLPLYIQDFMTDEKLSECSATANGVYIRIMCLMHKSEEYGTILLKQKDIQTDNQILDFALKLSKHLPYDVAVINAALVELLDEEVLKLVDNKLIQKRMVKDNDLSEKRAIAGKKGGDKNPFAQAKVEPNTEPNISTFAKAKTQPNAESENEIVIEKKVDSKKKDTTSTPVKVKELPREIVYPFTSQFFKDKWNLWKEYKAKQLGFKFKTELSEQAALKHLAEISHGDQKTAAMIIEQSMGNGWSGLFELKTNANGKTDNNGVRTNSRITESDRLRLAEDLLAAVNKGTATQIDDSP